MSGFLPLLLALVLVETGWRVGASTPPRLQLAAVAAGLVFWALTCETVVRLFGRWRHRPRRALERWDVAAHLLVLAGFGVLCLGLGWPRLAGTYTLALLPWVAAQSLHWWTLAHASDGRWTRRGHLWHQWRFALLPVAVVLPVLDLCDWLGAVTGLERWSAALIGPAAAVLGSFLLAAVLVAGLPWALVRLWRARPLADPGLEAEFRAACRRFGVGIGAFLVWPSSGGRFHNAMMVGVLPRLRYVLFTSDLLLDFTRAQLLAVLGHELGHARHRHLWLFLLFAVVAGLSTWILAPLLAVQALHLPGAARLPAAALEGLAALVLLAAWWRLAFGVLSRACERQADLAGAELAGDPAAMQEALRAVGRFAGQEEDAPSWRHHSLRQRIDYLALVARQPGEVLRHHRRVAFAWWMLGGTAAGLVAALVVRGQLHWKGI